VKGIYKKRDSAYWYIRYGDENRKQICRSSHSTDRAVAEKMLSEIRARIKDIRDRMRYIVNPDTGCWEWQGSKSAGYGTMRVNYKPMRAHRYFYEKHKGPIPKGLHVDHLCWNPGCVNPDHLEAVSPGENTRRSSDLDKFSNFRKATEKDCSQNCSDGI